MRSVNRLRWSCAVAFLLGFSVFAARSSSAAPQAVKDSPEAAARLQQFAKHQTMLAKSPFKDLKWTGVGPMRPSGRMTDVEAHPAQPGTIYAAAAQGGVWKSIDDGVTWTGIFENYPTASIGDLAIAPSDPKIVWVGTGEANIFRSSMAGIGIFKSVDAGQRFTYMGLADTQHISRILVHPTSPDIVYVASAGHEYTFSPDRGVYKTTNGGRTWQKVFYKNERTGVIDLAMDPSDPNILYAGTAQRLRYRWNDPVESIESGLYKTTDGGRTWTALTSGLPDFSKGECERIGISVGKANPNVVYVVINQQPKEAAAQGAYLYRSDDKGGSFKLVEGNEKIRATFAYGWVFGQVRVDPGNPDVVYVMGLNYLRSRDGGATWENLRGNHVDYHGMWIDPTDSNHVLVVNDGGIAISHDGLATFTHPVNLPIGHLFSIAVSQTKGTFWAVPEHPGHRRLARPDRHDRGPRQDRVEGMGERPGRRVGAARRSSDGPGHRLFRHALRRRAVDGRFQEDGGGAGAGRGGSESGAADGTAGAAAGRSGRASPASGRCRGSGPDGPAARARLGCRRAQGRAPGADDHRP